ncbi:MAG: 30S ribosomal protein S17 [Piscirickettsiaceae bacterium]|nr:MAG: 30S ribosomal protein S17 [Piscirickettsiaceae bacterium]PCI70533.1 MAG: 30S ribosomal protein S17 [Piscirickettsiaceae bacterium]
MSEAEKSIRTITGLVISNKADKTITVKVTRQVKHPLYGKVIKKSSNFHAHDESNTCSEGDLVSLVSCRPLSKSKTWKLHEILEKTK